MSVWFSWGVEVDVRNGKWRNTQMNLCHLSFFLSFSLSLFLLPLSMHSLFFWLGFIEPLFFSFPQAPAYRVGLKGLGIDTAGEPQQKRREPINDFRLCLKKADQDGIRGAIRGGFQSKNKMAFYGNHMWLDQHGYFFIDWLVGRLVGWSVGKCINLFLYLCLRQNVSNTTLDKVSARCIL